jgi:hypothetical protein
LPSSYDTICQERRGRRRKQRQLELDLRSHGGRRKGEKAEIAHAVREEKKRLEPLLVTGRRADERPCVRGLKATAVDPRDADRHARSPLGVAAHYRLAPPRLDRARRAAATEPRRIKAAREKPLIEVASPTRGSCIDVRSQPHE